jgi:hypothetical protein
MPHEARIDRIKYCVWIAGAPGVGYNTVGEILQGQSIETYGYRTSHRKPKEWYIATDVIRYHITNPELRNPFWYGFGQNWLAIADLPWRRVGVLVVSNDILTERVLEFRRKHQLRLDQDDEFVNAAIQSQRTILGYLDKLGEPYVRSIDAERSPAQIVQDIRALFHS